jgi:hypothetical protein
MITLIGVVFAVLIIVKKNKKRQWIVSRFIAERLRQLYFQFIINNLTEAEQCLLKNDGNGFEAARSAAIARFKSEILRSPEAALQRMIEDIAERNAWIFHEWRIQEARNVGIYSDLKDLRSEILEFLYHQRIGIQQRYVLLKNFSGIHSPKFWKSLTVTVTNLVTIMVFVLTLLVGIAALVHGSSEGPFVVYMSWAAGVLGALLVGARAVDEGFQVKAETDRYDWYLSSINAVDQDFLRGSTDDKIRALREVEELSYVELRQFCISLQKSKFFS